MSAIAQADIDTLLTHLQDLRHQISETRGAIAPMETNLTETYDEFQAVVGGLRRQSMRLQSEIATLNAQIDSIGQEMDDDLSFEMEDVTPFEMESDRPVDLPTDPEAVEKDMLLEHLFYILDPMTNDDDGELLATLQGMCQDPGIRFAHVLEELPWGLVWTQRSPQEQLEDQHHRLSSWEAVLKKQLETLQRAGDRLRNDPRYGLWQQRQQGSDHWQEFLDQYAQQQQDQNAELQAELEKVQQEWSRLTESKVV